MKVLACFVLCLENEEYTCANLFGDQVLLCNMSLFESRVAR